MIVYVNVIGEGITMDRGLMRLYKYIINFIKNIEFIQPYTTYFFNSSFNCNGLYNITFILNSYIYTLIYKGDGKSSNISVRNIGIGCIN